jgi:predicted nucleic acid-binding protein
MPRLRPRWPVLVSAPITAAGRQVHDTNIVATMLEHGIYRLLTFNAADFRRFAGIIALKPPQ